MKKKKYVTRKVKSIRRLLLCLILLTALVLVNGYGFTRGMVFTETEDYLGTGELTELSKLPDVSLKGTAGMSHYLLQNENCMLHLYTNFNVFMGFYRDASSLLDCSGDAPVHAASHTFSTHKDADKTYAVYFGRVDDPDIERIEIVYKCFDEETTLRELSIKIDSFIYDGDQRYFYSEKYLVQGLLGKMEPPDYYCYNAEGELVYSSPLYYRTSTSIG